MGKRVASKGPKPEIAMPRKPSKPDDPEQSKRFIETAEEALSS